MRNTKYVKIANKHRASENKLKNAVIAFLSGGTIGFLGEAMIEMMIYFFDFSEKDASSLMIIGFIFIASLCTALGFFDYLVTFCRAGMIIPITGFAHSMTSAALDCRGEGLIYGIGSNMFRLAGSVIVYGVVSAVSLGIVRYFIGMVIG